MEQNTTADLTITGGLATRLAQPVVIFIKFSFFCMFFSYLNIQTERLFISLATRALLCSDAWFLWSPSSSEPRGALLTFFNDYFSSVENLSQNEHDSAFTWQVHCAIYTKTFLPSSLDVQTSWFLFCFLGDFLLSSFWRKGIFTDCIVGLWNFLDLSPFSKKNLDSHQATSPPPETVGGGGERNSKGSSSRCAAHAGTDVWHRAHRCAHFLSARRSHTHPETVGLDGSGIWHNTK